MEKNSAFLIADLHTHTDMSHGKHTAREMVETAIQRGLTKIAITDHGLSHVSYGVRNLEQYIRRIQELKKEYKSEIDLLLGIELNLISLDGDTDMPGTDYQKEFDLILMGYHKFVRMKNLSSYRKLYIKSEKNREQYTNAILKAMERYPIHVLTHPGYGLFVDLLPIAMAAEKHDVLFEINNKHELMTKEDLQQVATTNVRFLVSSDAHKKDEVGRAERAMALAKSAGILNRVVNLKNTEEER